MQAINDEIQQSQPWKISIAEGHAGQMNGFNERHQRWWARAFDAQWEAQFVHALRFRELSPRMIRLEIYMRFANVVSHGYNGNAFEARYLHRITRPRTPTGTRACPEEILARQCGQFIFSKKGKKKRFDTGRCARPSRPPGIPDDPPRTRIPWKVVIFSDAKPLDWTKQQAFHRYPDDVSRHDPPTGGTGSMTPRGLKGQSLNVFPCE